MIKITFLILILLFLTSSEQQYYTIDDYDGTNDEICTLWNYQYSENEDFKVCNNDCKCDGKRTCVYGCCTGIARTAEDLGEIDNQCLNQDYSYYETDFCESSCECDGRRFCKEGECSGFSFIKFMCDADLISEINNLMEQELKNKSEKELQQENCGCLQVSSNVFNLIVDITDEDTYDEEDACQYLVDQFQGRMFDKVCSDGMFCDTLELAFDTLSEDTIDQPFVYFCQVVIESMNKQGFKTKNLTQQIENADKSLDQIKQDIADTTCGTLMCNSSTYDKCSKEEKGGVMTDVFDAVCDIIGDGEIANLIKYSLLLTGAFILILI